MNMEENHKPRDQKLTVQIEMGHLAWLWRERRRRERSIAWIVNQAIGQYRDRIDRPKRKGAGQDD